MRYVPEREKYAPMYLTKDKGEIYMFKLTNNELNEKAVEAKNNEAAVWEVKAHYMDIIERLASDNWYKMNNEASFIDTCNRHIEYAVRTYDPTKGSFDKRVNYFFDQALRENCGKRGTKRKGLDSIDRLTSTEGEDGSEYSAFYIEDSGNSVEDIAFKDESFNELLTELSGEDVRKKSALYYLEQENGVVMYAAERLAQDTGRETNTERIFINRFLKSLREGAASYAV